MFSPSIARGLRDLGHDVVASQDDEQLRLFDDSALFAYAAADKRAVVTENAKDFLPLVQLTTPGAQSHFGLILTSNSSFPRHHDRFVGEIVRALDDLLGNHEGDAPHGFVHWLRQVGP